MRENCPLLGKEQSHLFYRILKNQSKKDCIEMENIYLTMM